MRNSFLVFIALGLISFTSSSTRAQRSVGGRSLVLDDGLGHLVNITIPTMVGPGPYSWTIPITPGGIGSGVIPAGTTDNSTLRWDAATQTWQENTSMFVTNFGAISSNSLSILGGIISAPSSAGTNGTSLSITAGNSGGGSNGADLTLTAGSSTSFGNGGNARLFGGNGSAALGGNGGFVIISGGSGGGGNTIGGDVLLLAGSGSGTFKGGDAYISGGTSAATGTGGSVFLQTTLNSGTQITRMTITPAGLVGIGPGTGPAWPFQVDQSGNLTANNLISSGTFSMHYRTENSGSTTVALNANDDIVYIQNASTTGFTLPVGTTAGQELLIYNGTGAAFTTGTLHVPNGQSALYFYNGGGWVHVVPF
jgi:hypothetical protein